MRGNASWTRRLALDTELNWTDFDDGMSQDLVKDLLLVGEGKEDGRTTQPLGEWRGGFLKLE